jgi:hypothetical protein
VEGACWLRSKEEEMQRAKERAAACFVFRKCYFRFRVRKNILFISIIKLSPARQVDSVAGPVWVY